MAASNRALRGLEVPIAERCRRLADEIIGSIPEADDSGICELDVDRMRGRIVDLVQAHVDVVLEGRAPNAEVELLRSQLGDMRSRMAALRQVLQERGEELKAAVGQKEAQALSCKRALTRAQLAEGRLKALGRGAPGDAAAPAGPGLSASGGNGQRSYSAHGRRQQRAPFDGRVAVPASDFEARQRALLEREKVVEEREAAVATREQQVQRVMGQLGSTKRAATSLATSRRRRILRAFVGAWSRLTVAPDQPRVRERGDRVVLMGRLADCWQGRLSGLRLRRRFSEWRLVCSGESRAPEPVLDVSGERRRSSRGQSSGASARPPQRLEADRQGEAFRWRGWQRWADAEFRRGVEFGVLGAFVAWRLLALRPIARDLGGDTCGDQEQLQRHRQAKEWIARHLSVMFLARTEEIHKFVIFASWRHAAYRTQAAGHARDIKHLRRDGAILAWDQRDRWFLCLLMSAWRHAIEEGKMARGVETQRKAFCSERAMLRHRVARHMWAWAGRNSDQLLEVVLGRVLALWRGDARYDAFARTAAARFEELEEHHEENVERLVYLQAGRTDTLCRRLYWVRSTADDLVLLQHAFHILSLHAQSERTKKSDEDIKVLHEHQLALMVHAQDQDRWLIRRERAQFCSRYVQRSIRARFFVLWYHAGKMLRMELLWDAKDALRLQDTDRLRSRTRESADLRLRRLGEVMERRTEREWRALLLYAWLAAARRAHMTRRTFELKEELGAQLHAARRRAEVQIEECTQRLRSEMERFGWGAYVQILFTSWERMSAERSILRKAEGSLQRQAEAFEAAARGREVYATRRHRVACDGAAFLLQSKAEECGARVVLRAWREGLLRARLTEVVERWHVEGRRLRLRHEEALGGARAEFVRSWGRLSIWLERLQRRASRDLIGAVVLRSWRSGCMFTRREHRKRQQEVHDAAFRDAKHRVLYMGETMRHTRDMGLLLRSILFWRSLVQVQGAARQHHQELLAAESVKAQQARLVKAHMQDRIPTFFRVTDRTHHTTLAQLVLNVWLHLTKVTSMEQAALQLRGNVDKHQMELWKAKDRCVSIMAKIPRRVLLMKAFVCFGNTAELRRMEADCRSLLARRWEDCQASVGQLREHYIAEQLNLLDALTDMHHRLHATSHEKRMCVLMFYAWYEHVRSQRDHRMNAQQRERHMMQRTQLSGANSLLLDARDRYAYWLYECHAIIAGMRALYAWHAVSKMSGMAREVQEIHRETSSRVASAHEQIAGHRRNLGWKAASSLARASGWLLLNEVFRAWQRDFDRGRLGERERLQQRAAQANMDKYRLESRKAYDGMRAQMQDRWKSAEMRLLRAERAALATRSFLLWAMLAKTGPKGVACDFEELQEETRFKREMVVRSGLLSKLPQVRSQAYDQPAPQLAWVHPASAGHPERRVPALEHREVPVASEAVLDTLHRLAKARSLMETDARGPGGGEL